MVEPINIVECLNYVEDPYVCYGDEEASPKGQCINCGAKWYEHLIDALPENEKESAIAIQSERGIHFVPKARQ